MNLTVCDISVLIWMYLWQSMCIKMCMIIMCVVFIYVYRCITVCMSVIYCMLLMYYPRKGPGVIGGYKDGTKIYYRRKRPGVTRGYEDMTKYIIERRDRVWPESTKTVPIYPNFDHMRQIMNFMYMCINPSKLCVRH